VKFLRSFLRESLLNKVDYKTQHLTECHDEGLKVRMIKILVLVTLGLILPLLNDGISCTCNYNEDQEEYEVQLLSACIDLNFSIAIH
jgi:hypothetical protein